MSNDLYPKILTGLFMYPSDRSFHQSKRQFEKKISLRKQKAKHGMDSKDMNYEKDTKEFLESENDLNEIIRKLERTTAFSLFNQHHRNIVSNLMKILLNTNDVETFVERCLKAKEFCPPQMFLYCYATILGYRKDLQHIPIPNSIEIFPHNYLDSRHVEFLVKKNKILDIYNTPSELVVFSSEDEEDGLCYFRDDIGVNNHHWHWYSMFPSQGPSEIIQRERRGELFLYWHHQIIARYNCERLTNGLEKVKSLDISKPIEEAYFPKFINGSTKRIYPYRLPNQYLRDIDRDDIVIRIAKIHENYQRILQAIEDGFVINEGDGRRIYLHEEEGIDIIGNIIEGSNLSVNKSLYGDICNELHLAVAYIHDPLKKNWDDIGVMGDIATSIRDPVFYRVHNFIDEIFFKFKNTLGHYDKSELAFNKIEITKGFIGTQDHNVNLLKTYWQVSSAKLGTTLDLRQRDTLSSRFQHLQYKPFHYFLQIMNHNQLVQNGTCRIFLAPRKDQRGRVLKMSEQRLLAIEMDKFSIRLLPGLNPFLRSSLKSSITTPYSQTFKNQGSPTQSSNRERSLPYNCGWPQHMLVPKGTSEGREYVFFIMISDEIADSQDPNNVKETEEPISNREFQETFYPQQVTSDGKYGLNTTGSCYSLFSDGPNCGPSLSFYDLHFKKNSDRRAMGFPLDRVLLYDDLNDFAEEFPNMLTINVKIQFDDLMPLSDNNLNKYTNR